ncbi:MAG: hypothetical protein RIC55_16620 [Pirellulaceae bacterium]
MSETFDAYYKWLAIPPEEQPPHHYRLLGLRLYEADRDVIETAADQRMAHLRKYQSGKHGSKSQVLLNEVAHAKICLMDPKKRARYDEQLRRTLAEQAVASPSLPAMPLDDPLADLPPDVYAPTPAAAYYQAASATPAAAYPRWMWPVLISVACVALLSLGGLLGFVGILLTRRDPNPVVAQNDPPAPDARDATGAPPAARDASNGGRSEVVDAGAAGPSDIEVSSPTSPTPSAPSERPPLENPTTPSTPTPGAPTPIRPTPGGAAPSTAAPSIGGSPSPATTPTGGALSPGAGSRPAKTDPPSQAMQAPLLPKVAEAFQTLEGIYPNDQALIDEVIKLAAESNDSTEKFVMLRQAMDRSLTGDDASLLARVIDALDADFEFDADDLRRMKFAEFARQAANSDAIGSIVPISQRFVDHSMEHERCEVALEVINAVYTATQRPAGAKHRKEVYDLRKEVLRRHDQWTEVQRARDVLAKSPHDPAANLTLGWYLCLEKGDFEAGIPHLAKSNDRALKPAAQRDLAVDENASLQTLIDVGDAWYDAATAASENEPFLARAHDWYSAASPRAAGLDARKVSARLQEIAQSKSAAKVLEVASRATLKPTDVASNTRPAVQPPPTTLATKTPKPTNPEPTGPAPRVASRPVEPDPRPMATRPIAPRPVVKSKGRGWPTATLRTTIKDIGSRAMQLAYAHDGSKFAAADNEGRIVVYSADTGEVKHELLGHDGQIRELAYSPTDDVLYSAGQDGTLRAWNDKGEQQMVANDPKYFSGLAISPDGRELVTTSFQLNRWDAATGKLKQSIDGGGSAMRGAYFSPDGKVLAVIEGRGGLQFVGAPRDVGNLAVLNGKTARSAAWSDDGSLFAYGSTNDDTMWIVDVKTGQVLSHHKVYNGSPHRIVFLPDNRTLITQNMSQMGIWDGPSGQFWQTIYTSNSGSTSIAMAPDGKSFVASGTDSALRIWDITWKDVLVENPVAAAGQGGWALHGVLPGDWQAAIDVAADGRLAALQRGSVTLFDLDKGEPLRSFQRPTLAYGAAAFSPDDKLLMVGAGKAVAVFDVATGELLNQSRDVAESEKACFTKDGKSLILAGRKSAVKVSIPDFRVERTYDLGDFMAVRGMALSPDGKTVAVGRSTGTQERLCMLFDTNSGEKVAELTGDEVFAYAPDGKAVACAGPNAIVEIATGKKLTPESFQGPIRCMAFHPDGAMVATGGHDGLVRLWSRKTGEKLAELQHDAAVVQLRFLPDGTGLLAVDMDNHISLWKKP